MIGAIRSAIPSILTQVGNAASSATQTQGAGSSFADVFQSAVNDVDGLQNSADQQVSALLQGHSSADVGKTMVSVEKADVAFQLMMQVRNKVVSAYQDMEKMQF